MRCAATHSPAAYLSSSLESQNIIDDLLTNVESDKMVPHFNENLTLYSCSMELQDLIPKEVLIGEKQRTLSVRIDSYLHRKLLESAEGMRDKVRLGSLGLPHAGDWLNAVPSHTLAGAPFVPPGI